MTYTSDTERRSGLLLPKLKQDDDNVREGTPGTWDFQGTKAYHDVAKSLDYQAPGEVKSISAVPTIWARPLSLSMALHNKNYPSKLREQMISMWQGMLAALALKEIRGLPLKAQLLQLGSVKDSHPFARAAYELLPEPVNLLYDYNDKDAWEDIFIFLWNNRPVGMTSPSTLVVPSEEGEWTGLQWWDEETGQLQSPHPYLNETERGQLAYWLNNLRLEVQDSKHNGDGNAITQIVRLLNEFVESLNAPTGKTYQLSSSSGFEVAINRGSLVALDKPVKPEAKPSNLQVVPTIDKPGVKPLIIIDEQVSDVWGIPSQNIWVYGDKNLASLQPGDIKRLDDDPDVVCLESKDLFLPELYFVDQEAILPGAVFPSGAKELYFNEERITPLIPLNPILLDYFASEDLRQKVTFQFEQSSGQVKVIFDLPLSGMNGDGRPTDYRLTKVYNLEEQNSFLEVPVLETWPHFRAKPWQEYYGFYYDADFGEETFQVSFPEANAGDVHQFEEGAGSYQIVRLNECPAYIECRDAYKNLIGLILLPTPPEVKLTEQWTVGVDFGTSFTNIFVNKNDKGIEPLTLEQLLLKITDVAVDTRYPVLFEFFVPETFVPADKPLPMSTVLTTRGYEGTEAPERPVFDGRIYIPDQIRFDPHLGWIKTNLKWLSENQTENVVFLKHLALHISAIAANQGVRDIQWSLSYPSAFSKRQRNKYISAWKKIAQELEGTTGINHLTSSEPTYFRTESLAMAQYFAEQEKKNLTYTTCIDMGGGTSDISIWQRNKLLHQCSIEFAGKHLFSQFLELNRQFLENPLKVVGADEWESLRGPAFNAKLDVWMRLEAATWLDKNRDSIDEDEQFLGLVRLMAIGVAGLYYYVGAILAVLHQEGKCNREEITPVYLGGNASRLLHWLSEGGEFDTDTEINELLSRMLSVGSGFDDTGEPTVLSSSPKDEAACGLVLKTKKLQGLDTKEDDPIIAGEDCEINDQVFEFNQRVEFRGNDINRYEIPKLTQLRTFLDNFHESLDDLGIEGIPPLEGYQYEKIREDDPEADYNQSLWRRTGRELESMLDDIHGSVDSVRQEPPFILGLKALLRVLGEEWAEKYK